MSEGIADVRRASRAVTAGSARAWVLAVRPATLTAGVVPVLVGSAVARSLGGFRLAPALAALAGAVLIQIGTNFANDVFDFEKGADTHARLGPVRVAQAGLLRPAELRAGMWLAFGLAALVGLYLASLGGWPIVVLGLLSIASGIAYTGGPWPLGYHGLGDLFVFVFFGLVAVAGTAFVQLGAVPVASLFAAVPVGAIATAVLVVNNVRDHRTDVHAGKRTLVVRFGRRFGVAEYALLLLLAYAAPIVMWAAACASRWVLLPLVTAPLAASLVRGVARHEGGPELNALLARTARLLLVFGVLFAAGVAL